VLLPQDPILVAQPGRSLGKGPHMKRAIVEFLWNFLLASTFQSEGVLHFRLPGFVVVLNTAVQFRCLGFRTFNVT
jgi:hypothetical protein